ncbi:serine/threonine-protein kinase Nek2 [Elysia marginata]|uniref:Serine/threonine-protein kinase greatwall n=1 Tax=Elysia marginata TaxID=1093978 RepID=A0AAV4J6E2_9GAST|nr:serine/threonine-protein kinase Nek2 [Elysia marginata]
MPYSDNGDLVQVEKKNGKPFDTKIITNSILHVENAAEYLHKHHLAYNDIKLENILVDKWGYIHLGDFGFVRQMTAETRTFRARDVGGTPTYWGPEMFQDDPHHNVDPFKTKLWSLKALHVMEASKPRKGSQYFAAQTWTGRRSGRYSLSAS